MGNVNQQNSGVSLLRDGVVALCQQAGQAILEIYQDGGDFQVQAKADDSPLTRADLAAHQILDGGFNSYCRVCQCCPKRAVFRTIVCAAVGRAIGWWIRLMAPKSLFAAMANLR